MSTDNAGEGLREAVEAVVAKANAMHPNNYKTGQDHLSPAFREVNFRAAFMALGRLMNEVEAALAEHPATPALDQDKLAHWLHDWVQAHGGTGMRDTGRSLVLECTCGTELGISYGPTDMGDPVAEALAYFRHQAADFMAVLR